MDTLQSAARQALNTSADAWAISFEGRQYSWADVRRVADAVNEAIDASGADAEATVALVARNRPSAIAALLGLIARGRGIRMIYPFQSPAAIASDIAKLSPAVVVAAAQDFAPAIMDAVREHRIAAIALHEMEARAVADCESAGASRAIVKPEHIEILTSGTTGAPKPFAVSYAMLFNNFVKPKLAALEQASSPPLPELLYFPLGNITGLYTTLPTALSATPIVLLDRFSLDAWRAYIREYKPAITGLPPSGIQMLLDADVPREELSCIQSMGTGAASLDPAAHRAFEERFGIPIILSYGATEFGGPVTRMTPELHAEWGEKKFGTVGRVFAGSQLRVVDPESGEILPAGAEGRLEVISPRIGPDWIRTSDLAIVDEDGFLFHRGRLDGAIMRGGFKILPETIERALMLHPDVSAAAIAPRSDRRLGQVPVAAVQLRPGAAATAEDLEAHLRDHVAATHIPTAWRIVAELPRTPSLKVDRRGVAALFD